MREKLKFTPIFLVFFLFGCPTDPAADDDDNDASDDDDAANGYTILLSEDFEDQQAVEHTWHEPEWGGAWLEDWENSSNHFYGCEGDHTVYDYVGALDWFQYSEISTYDTYDLTPYSEGYIKYDWILQVQRDGRFRVSKAWVRYRGMGWDPSVDVEWDALPIPEQEDGLSPTLYERGSMSLPLDWDCGYEEEGEIDIEVLLEIRCKTGECGGEVNFAAQFGIDNVEIGVE